MKNKIKGFTILELLVTMTLTGILVAFSFMGYNQIQKLFINYSNQSEFISEYNQLNHALFTLSEKSDIIEKINDDMVTFRSDSNNVSLELTKKNVLLKFKNHTDSFHIEIDKHQFNLLPLNSAIPSNLVNFFVGEASFQSQKFRVSFHKEYDTESVLKSTLEQFPPNEFH